MKNRRLIPLVLVIVMLMISITQTVFSATSDKGVYVIPIKGNVGPSMVSYVSDQIKKAESMNIDIVILDIDTLGGNLDSTLKIQEIIKNHNNEFKFYSFINNKAESAGVMISLLGDKIYMTEDATVGSASVIPYDEKTNSAWSSMLKAQAESKGKPSDIAKATADYNMEIKGVKEKGTLLNMTASEAKSLNFSDDTVNNIDDVIKKLEYRGDKVVIGDKDFKVILSEFISNPYISIALLLIGFILLITESFVPSFGILGTIGALCIGAYFLGNIFVGNTSWWALGILLLGVLLIIIELYIPGFGFFGVTGLVLVSVAIVMSAEDLTTGVMLMASCWIIGGLGVYILFKFGVKKGPLSKMILKSNMGSENYLPYDPKSMEGLLGKEGIANSMLRPAGTGIFDDQTLDIQSNGEFIKSGEKIKITKVEGNKIIVNRINN